MIYRQLLQYPLLEQKRPRDADNTDQCSPLQGA
jgi:hypothetical protein